MANFPESSSLPTHIPELLVTVESSLEEASGYQQGERDGRQDVGGGFFADPIGTVQDNLRRRQITLNPDQFHQQMAGWLRVAQSAFDQVALHPHMKLQELELTLEINGEGQVSLMGTGGRVSGKGGITLRFTAKEGS